MKRINHTIKRKKIPEVKLVSLIEPSWYDYSESDENLISWNEWDYLIKYALNDVVGYNNLKFISLSNNNINNEPTINSSKWEEVPSNTELSNNKGYIPTGLTPDTGFLVFNVTGGTVTDGYYKWNTPSGNTWNLIVGAPKTNLTNLSNRNPNDENGQPITGTTLFNTGTTYSIGYYEWNTPTSNSWNLFNQTSGNTYNTIQKVLNQKIYDDFQLPLFLEATADEMGDMVEFDKYIGHNKISANFTYNSVCTETGTTITINNSTTYQLVNIILANDTNPDGTTNVTGVRRLASEIPEQNVLNEFSEYIIIDGQDLSISGSSFTVHWGDETTSPIGINGSVTKSFDVAEEKTIRIVFESPYLTNQVLKVVCCGESAVSYMSLATQDDRIIKNEDNNYINVD